ncbi:uncharacterized protein LOC102807499 [Saccoglossus kowalevskii]
MYFVGISKYFLILSRLVAGVGSGAGAAIFAQITHTTTDKERTAAISVAMAARQVGLLIGPGLNLFLEHLNFWIGPWHVNALSAPGIFMTVLWILMELLVFFAYYDLPNIEEQEKILATEAARVLANVINYDETDQLIPNGEALSDTLDFAGDHKSSRTTWYDEEFDPQQDNGRSSGQRSNMPTQYLSIERTSEDDEFKEAKKYSLEHGSELYPGKWTWMKEYVREEVVVILTGQFFFLYNQTALETNLTPLAQNILGFGEMENSLFYCFAGLEVLLTFILVKILSKKIEDRSMLALGFAIEIVSISVAVWYFPAAEESKNESYKLAMFICIVLVQVFGLPFISACVVSMFSKHTTERTQGLSQGIRRGVANIGTILGPIWAGGTLNILYVNMGVMVGLLFLIIMMMILSWKHLKTPEKFWWLKKDQSKSINSDAPYYNDRIL